MSTYSRDLTFNTDCVTLNGFLPIFLRGLEAFSKEKTEERNGMIKFHLFVIESADEEERTPKVMT